MVIEMREIKFRGINNDGNWCFGDLIRSNNDHNVWIHAPKINHTYKVTPATVGQFTGLKDANGQEIYEGDILRFAPPWRWEEDERRVGVVVYKCYGFRIEYSGMSEALFNLAANGGPYSVIGNVYDSPELLRADHERD